MDHESEINIYTYILSKKENLEKKKKGTKL